LADASAAAVHSVTVITDKTNVTDPLSDVFAILVSVTRTIKIQNPLPFHKLCQKLANGDATRETLNCTVSL